MGGGHGGPAPRGGHPRGDRVHGGDVSVKSSSDRPWCRSTDTTASSTPWWGMEKRPTLVSGAADRGGPPSARTAAPSAEKVVRESSRSAGSRWV